MDATSSAGVPRDPCEGTFSEWTLRDLVFSFTEVFQRTTTQPRTFVTFPVTADKIPIVKKWNDLTTSHPVRGGGHFGIQTGARSGVTVIDCDVIKKNESREHFVDGVDAMVALLQENEGGVLPHVPTIRTPSGGLHFYFSYEHDVPSKIQGIPGEAVAAEYTNKTVKIDVLNDNKYVVGPSSPGYSHWNFVLKPPVHMPTWLLQLVKGTKCGKRPASLTPLSARLRKAVGPRISSSSDEDEDNRRVDEARRDAPQPEQSTGESWAWEEDNEWWSGLEVDERLQQGQPVVTPTALDVPNPDQPGPSLASQPVVTPTALDVPNPDQPGPSLALQNSQSQVIGPPTSKQGTAKIVPINLKQLEQTVMKIPAHHADNYSTWLNVVWAIAQTGKYSNYDSFPLADRWSRQSTKYKNSDDVKSKFEQSDGRLGYPYLHSLAFPKRRILNVEAEITCTSQLVGQPSSELQDQSAVSPGNIIPTTLKGVRSHMEVVEAVLGKFPELRKTHVYFKTPRGSAIPQGLYVAHPRTNLWELQDVVYARKVMYEKVGRIAANEAEKKAFGQFAFLSSVTTLFCDSINDPKFDEKLDSDLNVFAFNNKLWDTRTNDFQPITPEHYISHTCGWDFSEDEAEANLSKVESLLAKIFPNERIRQHVLYYISSLLHGYRLDRHFLVLTDRRSGSNGKSTFIKLLQFFFGDYFLNDPDYVLEDTSGRSRHGHKAGHLALHNKRLLVGDEFTNKFQLDSSLVRRLTGGQTTTTGRSMYSQTIFKFPFQAGLILSFNEGDCPRFNHHDEALLSRLVAIPMLSKFDPALTADDPASLTFVADPTINTDRHMEKLRSGFFSILTRNYRRVGVSALQVPPEIDECLDEGILKNAPVRKWLATHLQPEDNEEDFTTLDALYKEYDSEHASLSRSLFDKLARAYCKQHNIAIQRNFYFNNKRSGSRGHKRLCLLRHSYTNPLSQSASFEDTSQT